MNSKRTRKLYLQLLPILNKAVKYVQEQLFDLPASDFVLECNIKPFKSVKRKMEERKTKNMLELSDLARARLYFSEQYTFKEVLGLLKQLLGKHIRHIEKKREHHLGLDYHGVIHVDMDINGIQFEMQLLPIEFKPHKELLHRIYEELREEHHLPDHHKKMLRILHNKMTNKLDEIAAHNRKKTRERHD